MLAENGGVGGGGVANAKTAQQSHTSYTEARKLGNFGCMEF